MKVLITGATGLIGTAIIEQCHLHNHQVHYLTTRKEKINQQDELKGFYWDPTTSYIDTACLEGVDMIINLAGATVSKRWTSAYKKELFDSRIQTVTLLHQALRSTSHSVKSIVLASAIGIYPSSPDRIYDEDEQEVDSGFLGKLTFEWEKEAAAFDVKIKVSKIRIGIVLSPKGGALYEMIKPISKGLGAAFGNGKQWQSWIHIEDLARLFLFVGTKELEGVFNGVAPVPVTNLELSKKIADTLKKPFFLPPIPRFLMKIILGEMSYILFASQRVSSKKVEEAGFNFLYPNVESALENLLLTK